MTMCVLGLCIQIIIVIKMSRNLDFILISKLADGMGICTHVYHMVGITFLLLN